MKKARGILGSQPNRIYNFVDKDPVIDVWRTAFIDSGYTLKEIEERGGAKVSTNRRQFDGPTRRTLFDTLMTNMRAAGGDVQFLLPSGKLMKIPKVPKAPKSSKAKAGDKNHVSSSNKETTGS